MIVTVGRIGRAHGIRGEVNVEVRTDTPDERFADGAVLATDPARRGPLTVLGSRWHSGRLLVAFDGVTDRTAAEGLRGILLLAEIPDDATTGDPDEFFDHQLVGLTVVGVDGDELGVVREIIHAPSQDILSVERTGGGEALVPFVTEIVPEVDVAGSRLIVDPPPGLFE
ncbi:ribosome maturation factor RimM [Jiangella aurantiaca]|uniref:Ribosome maturation factor RimM n=1 Tax=Jiangella aurantiaca TaxID=2530373 RepID=A0A4R5A9U1_9ACTN|nr:ribosome maturation factor RimM [Jiangella aurantiaca]TDD67990.1 ribosome maturation factor RimM [Jiangella aurantiaca]